MKPVINETLDIKDWYLSHFKNREIQTDDNHELPIHRMRKDAIQHLSQIGFPTARSEDWKYTNLLPILQQRLRFAEGFPRLDRQRISPWLYPDSSEYLIVLINGQFSEILSHLPPHLSGITILSLNKIIHHAHPLADQYLGRYAPFSNEPFTALNTAFAQEGVLIHIPVGLEVSKPIHILQVSDPQSTPFQSHTRHLVIAEKDSKATVLETRHHLSDATYFHNSVTEIVVQENAELNWYTLQDESRESSHITRTQIRLQRDSRLTHAAIDLGGALVRNNLGITLDGENSEANLFGFYLTAGRQHVDNHTNIDHLKPHCRSNEHYKGILTDRGSAAFSGTIYVARDAQKTNAFQANRSLLLSEEAEINSKPQLKIFADDVKCTHGATIGLLDDDAIFYLQQRGIDRSEAQTLLRAAFAGEILEKIAVDGLRNFIERNVSERLRTEF